MNAAPLFSLRSGAPRRADSGPLPRRTHPDLGAVLLTADGRAHILVAKIGAGGEGTVYRTSSGLACKVYDPARFTRTTLAKLELMSQRQLDIPGVCWPTSVASTRDGDPVGYFMPVAAGHEVQRSIFVKPLLTQTFPRWDRLNLARATATVLRSFVALHEHNVLVGDVNPRNVLLADEATAYLVDADSFQVEDFACPVGTPPFLHPELAGRDLGTVLRSPIHESFAVSTFVFMMLMPGKPPYSHAGGGDPVTNVRTRHFPYPLGERRAEKAPDGPWRYMWSHLPRSLRQAFHDVFVRGDVKSARDWLELVDGYARMLDGGKLGREIHPRGFRKLSREEVERHGGRMVRCTVCNAEFGERDAANAAPVCPACTPAPMNAVCRACGSEFRISGGEQVFFQSRQLSIPRRCKPCRATRGAAPAPTAAPASPGAFGPSLLARLLFERFGRS